MTNPKLELHSAWEIRFDEDGRAYYAITSYLSREHACNILTREIEGEEEGSRYMKYLDHAYHFNDATVLVSRSSTAPQLQIRVCASKPKVAEQVLEQILRNADSNAIK